jgi:hypothetical protein
MARKKTAPDRQNAKLLLAKRLKQIRMELFGDHGGPELGRLLNIPARTWYNYEMGVTVPAEVILRFIDATAVEPKWLLTGLGPRHREGAAATPRDGESGRQSTSNFGDILNQISDRLEQGQFVLNVSWQKSKPAGGTD